MTAQMQPKWLNKVLSDCNTILSLSSGWDSYSAREIDPKNVQFGLDLLAGILSHDAPAPAIVPISSGSVQFEWHRNGIDFEIEILAPGSFSFEFNKDEKHESSDRETDFQRLKSLAATLI